MPSLLLVFLLGSLLGAPVAMWAVADSFYRLGRTGPFTVWLIAGVVWALFAFNGALSGTGFLFRSYVDILATGVCLAGAHAAHRHAPDAPAPGLLDLPPLLAAGLLIGVLNNLTRPIVWILTGDADWVPF